MKQKLSRYLLILPVLALSFLSCTDAESLPTSEERPVSSLLAETEDYGQEYLDSFIFFGESTTYHMKAREVLRGGKDTTQIWAPDSGTVNLDSTTVSLRLRYPDTGEYLTLAEAAARKKPEYMVLTFGLNGAVQNVKRGKEYYKRCYQAVLDSILGASPHTKILLQSAFPVAENMDMSRYTVTVDELNACIEIINGWVAELAEEYNLGYLNTSEILKDGQGRLKMEYQNGDGHHLTREAYLKILYYIRTHGYPKEAL